MYNPIMLPLLRTKTSIPAPRTNRVERTRLIERINEGMKRTLTLIVAPAGFGKTTLIAEWAGTKPMPVAWLSLQQSDRALERFLSYVIYSLQQLFPQVGQTALAMLRGGQAVNEEAILFSLVNDLSEIPNDFALILDDHHTVDGSDVNTILQSILEHCPTKMHIGVTSRTMPELSLARLRALDQIVEINATDLRFNEAEVRAFLEQMGTSLTPEQLTHLNQSTEGWAVGLQLAGLALARQPFDWNIPAGQAHIFDYLAEEVLRRESLEVQEFLKVSSLFDRFSASLIDYAVRNTNYATTNSSTDILSHIERANLFLIPLDPSGTWFRYHALFTEFLRRQLPPEQASQHYHAASLWFEENNLLDEAIHYATHAADFVRAASLLESHYLDMVQRGEQSALLEWLSALPPEIMECRPRLWLAKGWANIIGLNSAEAQACAEKAKALIPLDGTGDNPRLRGEAKSLRILTGIFAGKVAAADEISEAFVLLAEQDDLLHSLLHFNLGLHHVMLGNTTLALDSFAETLRITKDRNDPLVTIFAGAQTGEVRQMRGALGLAERAFQQTTQYARETLGEHTFLLGIPFVSYGELLRELNRFDEAVRHLEQGIAHCQVWQPVASMDGRVALARLKAAQGCWDDAYSELEHAMKIAEGNISVLDDTFVAIQLIRLNLLQGNLLKAQQLIKTYDLEKASEGMYFHIWECTQLVLLRAKTATLPTDPKPAPAILESLSTLIAESERRERVTPVIEASILKAYAHHTVAEHTNAVESLSHALTLGAQSGYIRIFADEGKTLLHLLEQYHNKIHAPHTYVDEITELLRKETTNYQSPITKQSTELQPLTPLTRRELDILQLLAAGKSNQEIAKERVLTLNTVKKHVGNILSKMGVANRTQAVMLAKKLGWME
jgi:LuxR family maltose regulon positive regulatory protein